MDGAPSLSAPTGMDPQACAFHEHSRGEPSLLDRGLIAGRAYLASLPTASSDDACDETSVTVPVDGGTITATVYRPQVPDQLPALLFVHGGGWIFDSLATPGISRRLAIKGRLGVVAVDYRLAPEHQFPGPLDDCTAALEWICRCGHEYGLDAGRIAVCGESSGGNLAAALALRVRDQGGPVIAEQILVCPVLDPTMSTESWRKYGADFTPSRDQMEWMWRLYVPSRELETHPYAAPGLATDLSGLPRATILTAEFDPLRDEGEQYAARLHDSGVITDMERCAGQLHAVFGMARYVDACAATLGRIAGNVGSRLKELHCSDRSANRVTARQERAPQ
jgi:acetyl esterase